MTTTSLPTRPLRTAPVRATAPAMAHGFPTALWLTALNRQRHRRRPGAVTT